MARKIFVSYKFSDSGVQSLLPYPYQITTVRDYVDYFQQILDANDYIYKGENDNESLADFKDETIQTKLKDKIFDSSITVVFVSKNMKALNLPESEQWIPWEVSYSLKEITRNGRTSTTNAMLAVVLPDEYGRYEYFVEPLGCSHCNGVTWKINTLFSILGKNMFNRKAPNSYVCSSGTCGQLHTGSDHSYIYPVKWFDFVKNINVYFDLVSQIKQNIDDFNIRKSV